MAVSFIQIMDNAVKGAIFTRFKSYLNLVDQNTGIVFFPFDIAQREIAEKRGVANVEFINVWRDHVILDWQRNQAVIARDGVMMEYVNSSTRAAIVVVKGVPVQMDYTFWMWSRDLDKLMKATESYMLWQYDKPNIKLFYNGLYEMDMYLKFEGIMDEGSITKMYDKGLYYTARCKLKMDGWVLQLTSLKTILTIILDVYLREGTAPNFVDTLLDEYIITADSITIPNNLLLDDGGYMLREDGITRVQLET